MGNCFYSAVWELVSGHLYSAVWKLVSGYLYSSVWELVSGYLYSAVWELVSSYLPRTMSIATRSLQFARAMEGRMGRGM